MCYALQPKDMQIVASDEENLRIAAHCSILKHWLSVTVLLTDNWLINSIFSYGLHYSVRVCAKDKMLAVAT